jgi:serine/threonine protein kinase/tetratricopeptide (TPR) repeat protein
MFAEHAFFRITPQDGPVARYRNGRSDYNPSPMHDANPIPTADPSISHPRYQILQHIGHGGMGVVVQARDRFLQRDLAIKVLAADRASSQEFVDRFIEEAQIAGQLQHPNIVPIHDIGKLQDDRPFFAMKLVKGLTLESLLDLRKSLDDDQQRWIGVFLQVCQAIAFAHSKGVIHRDLKPSNIMIGRFDEVQVMDWGLAKILQKEVISNASLDNPKNENPKSEKLQSESIDSGHLDADQTQVPVELDGLVQELSFDAALVDRSVVQSIRYSANQDLGASELVGLSQTRDPSSLTSQGFIIGTLAYMSPEQANGVHEEMDTHSDVFSLGGILARILSGAPPYVADTKMERVHMASSALLQPCFQRLSKSPYDNELIELCQWCLAKDPSDRPKDASIVVERLTHYRSALGERIRQAELDRTAADVRLGSSIRANQIERKKRQWAWLATVVGAALILLAVGSYAWIASQQSAIRLAESNERVANLERERERNARLEQSRLEQQQSLVPIRLAIDQWKAGEILPTSTQWSQLASQFTTADELFQREPEEIRNESDLSILRERYEKFHRWFDAIHGPTSDFFPTSLSLLNATASNASAELAPDLESLPRWASDRVRVEWLQSIYDKKILPSSLSPTFIRNEWEAQMWSAIEAKDVSQLIELSESESISSQCMAMRLALAEALLTLGPAAALETALERTTWIRLDPTSIPDGKGDSAGITQDGWISFRNKSFNPTIQLGAKVPQQPIVAFRLETYCGTSFLSEAKWRIEPKNVDVESGTLVTTGLITAPSIAASVADAEIVSGPGEMGVGPENCNVREFTVERISSQGERVKLKFDRFLTGHTTISGREADFAVDNEKVSVWALGHPDGQSTCSTIFEARELEAWQFHSDLQIRLEVGSDELWRKTSIGPFRLYYSMEPTGAEASASQAALRMLDQLDRSYPGNGAVLASLARARLSTGIVADISRDGAVAMASVASSIDPDDSQSLRFFVETVLARQPNCKDPWYQRLIAQMVLCKNKSLSNEVSKQVALYQLQRGDRMHKLLPADAFEAYAESYRLSPTHFTRHGRLAYELHRNGKKDEAMNMANQGAAGTTEDPENLLFYGTVALRTRNGAEAFPVFERWYESRPEYRSIDDLQFVYARVCFQADQIDRGMEVVNQLDLKAGASPIIMTEAALSIARCQRTECTQWLLDTLSAIDTPDHEISNMLPVLRDRKTAWSVSAMAALELEQIEPLRSALEKKRNRYPDIFDEVIRSSDALFMARVPPLGPCVSKQNTKQLIQLLQRLQPNEPRWVVRESLLNWLDGKSQVAWHQLRSLPVNLDDAGDRVLSSEHVRGWQSMARVVAAVMRLVDSKSDPELARWRSPEAAQAEIVAAQNFLGRVPEGDRDLADWLWWEHRTKAIE